MFLQSSRSSFIGMGGRGIKGGLLRLTVGPEACLKVFQFFLFASQACRYLFNPCQLGKRLFISCGHPHHFLNPRLQFGTLCAQRTMGYQTDAYEEDSQDGVNGVQRLVSHVFPLAPLRNFHTSGS